MVSLKLNSFQPALTFNHDNLDNSHTKIGVFYGSLRAAGVWAENSIPTDKVALLDECKDVIPVGGKVSAEVTGDVAKMMFNWETIGSGDLLMLALQHHMDTIETNGKTTLDVDVLKGNVVLKDTKHLSYQIHLFCQFLLIKG